MTTQTARTSAGPNLPAIAVQCPTCDSAPGELCTSHGGTRIRRTDVHQARTAAWKRAGGAR
ncbi:hypothetical protein ACF09L_32865 [Streptomyces sp. NPDC014779]|uniref:zinc finger domain-containing protein n=1 Tax=Streptomyces sp. NPDC014779 TaxID=3364911 RepID=UPI0036FD89B6